MIQRRLIVREHALFRMNERGISMDDIRKVLGGDVIENYPNDVPYASRLMMAVVDARPIHVVAADVPGTDDTIIITAYEPDARRWDATFRLRKTT